MGEPRNRDTSRRPARVVPDATARVCVAEIGAAHGVAGEVRLRAFTEDPLAVTQFGPLRAEDGREIGITSLRLGKDCLIARLAGVADRTTAERLRNVKLYVARDKLPAICWRSRRPRAARPCCCRLPTRWCHSSTCRTGAWW